jgi:hypothetical protein
VLLVASLEHAAQWKYAQIEESIVKYASPLVNLSFLVFLSEITLTTNLKASGPVNIAVKCSSFFNKIQFTGK